MQANSHTSILFVCHGNICRSPAAEGAFKHFMKKHGAENLFYIDSAGTSGYHIGEIPNQNTRKAAKADGIILDHRARQFTRADFDKFDYIIAMDRHNLAEIQSLAKDSEDLEKTFLFRTYDPDVNSDRIPDTPDPYYGGFAGFRDVQNIAMRTAENLLKQLMTGAKKTEYAAQS